MEFFIEKNFGISSVNTRHFHSYYEFYYLLDGCVDYLVDDKVYNLNAGSLLIIPPYTIHRNVDASACNHTRIIMYVDYESFSEVKQFGVKLFDNPNMQFYNIKCSDPIHQTLLDVLNEFSSHKDLNMAKLLAIRLFLLMERKNDVYVSSVDKKMQNKQISRIINFINREYATDITLEYLAQYFGLNSTYLSRFFKKETGFNFSVYLNNLRISKAVNILNSTDYNITETAMAVGFHSCNHFCKTFKQIMGISPLSYKKRQIK
jgi:YesN/AraC family two-component response regulator